MLRFSKHESWNETRANQNVIPACEPGSFLNVAVSRKMPDQVRHDIIITPGISFLQLIPEHDPATRAVMLRFSKHESWNETRATRAVMLRFPKHESWNETRAKRAVMLMFSKHESWNETRAKRAVMLRFSKHESWNETRVNLNVIPAYEPGSFVNKSLFRKMPDHIRHDILLARYDIIITPSLHSSMSS